MFLKMVTVLLFFSPVSGFSAEYIVSFKQNNIGTVVDFLGENCPENYLPLNSNLAYSRTEYSELFQIIGTKYGAGDGTTSFNLPNLSGLVTRGAGTQILGGKTYTATLGQKRNDAMGEHRHFTVYNGESGSLMTGNVTSIALKSNLQAISDRGAYNIAGHASEPTMGRTSIAGSGTETHSADIALMKCVKAK